MPATVAGGHWHRWRLPALAVAAVLLAAVLSLVFADSQGRATSGVNAYTVPGVNDTNPSPDIVETTIVSDEATVDLGQGISANAQTYNGTIPGPTLRLKVNDTVIVHYENKLEHESAIHWHGIELANGMDGTPFTQNQVEPGGSFLYKFKVTRPGIYWYHPHHHSSTNQVFKGLYGLIIVTDPNEAVLQASSLIPSAANTKQVVLSDTTVCKAPGGNDAQTYNPPTPHVSGGAPVQLAPNPKDLCDGAPTGGAIDEDGAARGSYAAGDIPAIQTAATNGRTNEGQTVLTNGRNVGKRFGTPTSPLGLVAGAETMEVKAREGYRLQLLNAATVRYFRLILTTSTGTKIPLTRIGGEGGLLNTAVDEGDDTLPVHTLYTKGEILLPPGTRADVAFGIPAGTTGTLTLWTQDIDRTGQGFARVPTVPVMHLQVNGSVPVTYDIAGGDPVRSATGDLVETLGAPNATLLAPGGFAPPKLGNASQNISLDTIADPPPPGGGQGLGINGTFGTHEVSGDYKGADHLGSSRYAVEGGRLELTAQNTTTANHPFHLHGFSIQPIELTKAGDPTYTWPYKEFRDNVDIPKGYTLKYRLRLDARPMQDGTTTGGALGRWVFHCHIFFHATNGMLSELVVVPAANGNEAPAVDVSKATAAVEQDQEATITGSYKDRENNPVTLTTSVGTVTDTGGGNWSWKYTPTAADSSKIVAVTATDNGGRKGQTAFQLQVNNTPPVLGLPGDQTAEVGSTPNIAVSATDPNPSDPVALSASGLPAGLTLTDNGNRTAAITGTVSAPAGEYLATITANDGKNSAVNGQVKITVPPGKAFTGIVDRPERLKKGAITVGCRLTRSTLKSCRATVVSKKKRVGRATKTLLVTGTGLANVSVPLTTAIRRSIAKSVPGVAVDLSFLGTTFDVATSLADTQATRVVAPKVVTRPSLSVFNLGGAGLTKAGKTYLAKVAKQVGTAKRITCTARPPTAKARATAACAYLKARKLKAKFKSAGAGAPASRRIVLTIER
jgi:FtsP/CotA-like multicopper oxidase with cupredoxin domain